MLTQLPKRSMPLVIFSLVFLHSLSLQPARLLGDTSATPLEIMVRHRVWGRSGRKKRDNGAHENMKFRDSPIRYSPIFAVVGTAL